MAEEKAEAKKAEAPAPQGGGGQKPTLFIILAVVNMIVVAAVGFMVWQGNKMREAEPNIDDVIQTENADQKEEKADEDPFIGKLIPMETFLVNLAGSQGRKLAKINMELEVEGEKVEEEIEKRKPQIRDIIIILLSSKTYAQVADKEGKDFLRSEIRDTVNAFLTKGKIRSVYFTEFIYN